ncbi:MAG: alpha/beta hydrolase-fold protein, partial [Chloroflexota bacterium]
MSPFLLVRMPLQSIKNAIILLSMTTLISLLPLVHAQSDTCTSESTLTRETYNSAVLVQTMFYTVYTPPCYDENTTYPVMYLMHGSNEDDGHWQRLGLPESLDQRILNNEMSPVILVMPFGNVIANRNNFDTLSWNNIF